MAPPLCFFCLDISTFGVAFTDTRIPFTLIWNNSKNFNFILIIRHFSFLLFWCSQKRMQLFIIFSLWDLNTKFIIKSKLRFKNIFSTAQLPVDNTGKFLLAWTKLSVCFYSILSSKNNSKLTQLKSFGPKNFVHLILPFWRHTRFLTNFSFLNYNLENNPTKWIQSDLDVPLNIENE